MQSTWVSNRLNSGKAPFLNGISDVELIPIPIGSMYGIFTDIYLSRIIEGRVTKVQDSSLWRAPVVWLLGGRACECR